MEVILLVGFAAFVLWLHFLPTAIAGRRDHPNRTPIFVVNLFLGWTLIGWVIALAWALSAPPSGASANGGR